MCQKSGYASPLPETAPTPVRWRRRAPWIVLFGLPALLLAALGALLMPAPSADAATLSVCASGAPYTTIQAAVNAANAGDVIQICAGAYAESVNLSGMATAGDITLRGTAPVTIVPPSGPAIYNATAFSGSVTLENLRLTTSNAANAIDFTAVVSGSFNLLNAAVFEAGANGVMISGPLMDYLSSYINAVLADPSMGVAANVTTGDGTITIGLGQ